MRNPARYPPRPHDPMFRMRPASSTPRPVHTAPARHNGAERLLDLTSKLRVSLHGVESATQRQQSAIEARNRPPVLPTRWEQITTAVYGIFALFVLVPLGIGGLVLLIWTAPPLVRIMWLAWLAFVMR
jgi:hypothetical protein